MNIFEKKRELFFKNIKKARKGIDKALKKGVKFVPWGDSIKKIIEETPQELFDEEDFVIKAIAELDDTYSSCLVFDKAKELKYNERFVEKITNLNDVYFDHIASAELKNNKDFVLSLVKDSRIVVINGPISSLDSDGNLKLKERNGYMPRARSIVTAVSDELKKDKEFLFECIKNGAFDAIRFLDQKEFDNTDFQDELSQAIKVGLKSCVEGVRGIDGINVKDLLADFYSYIDSIYKQKIVESQIENFDLKSKNVDKNVKVK